MPACDFCNSAPGPDAERYSAQRLRSAVQAGYRPRAVLEHYRRAADSLGLDLGDDYWYGEWADQVRRDRTAWLLCRPCWSELEDYLATTGATPVPPPRRRRWFGMGR